MENNRWKIFGHTALTWFGFSILAAILTAIMQEENSNYSIIDAQGVVWSWLSLFMGAYLAKRFKRWSELGWGALFLMVCLIPVLGMFFGIGYFAWSYSKLEKQQ